MSKRKILLAALSLCMIAILAAGGTLAYLIDTEQQMNTFTAGKIFIELDETKIAEGENGFPVATAERTGENQVYKLRPGITVAKDPTVTLKEGSEDAYMGAIITITCADAKVYDERGNETTETMGLYDLIGVEGSFDIDITKDGMVTGGLFEDTGAQAALNGLAVYETEKCYIYQDAAKAESAKEWKLYIFLKNAYQRDNSIADDDAEVLFTNLNVPADYANSEMAVLGNLKIEIAAYAAQADGFMDCYTALTTAFPDDWSF